MPGGFVYLTAVMDWHSSFVLSWKVSITMETDFCINAVKSAIRRHGKPEVFKSDQGAQYTGRGFTDILKENDIKISMDGKGRWMDNVFIERLWRHSLISRVFLN
ncbi:MAG: DDE-type integrase/transposase/recombinase [Mariprofundus sp.]|nr:DDE-type integrase/transposase/recombinase [Mariprofundus sp.]